MKVSVCIGSCTVKHGREVLISFITTDPVTLNGGRCQEIGSGQPFKIHLHTCLHIIFPFRTYYPPLGGRE